MKAEVTDVKEILEQPEVQKIWQSLDQEGVLELQPPDNEVCERLQEILPEIGVGRQIKSLSVASLNLVLEKLQDYPDEKNLFLEWLKEIIREALRTPLANKFGDDIRDCLEVELRNLLRNQIETKLEKGADPRIESNLGASEFKNIFQQRLSRNLFICLFYQLVFLGTGRTEEAKILTPFIRAFLKGNYPLGVGSGNSFFVLTA